MHQFIFTPGEWIGEGKISFTESPEQIRFYTKWIVRGIESNIIRCEQLIEKEKVPGTLRNKLKISEITDNSFTIELENPECGKEQGRGIITPSFISWEFKERVPFEGSSGFAGFEVYTFLKSDTYLLHAEYFDEDWKTIVDGRIWKKS